MIIRLQHQRSDGENDIYHLKSGHRYHLGRGSACEVRILDLKLSRKHCAIEYSEGEWRVIDLASTNGCKVDGDQIVGSVALKTGTQIEIGQSTLKVIRILGDEEAEDDEAVVPVAPELGVIDASPAAPTHDPTARSQAAAAAPPAPSELRKPQPMKTPAPLEQLSLDDEGERLPSLEHSATDWEPEPVPEEITTGNALVPNANDPPGLAAEKALAKAREAAQIIARQAQAQGHTGEIQRPGSLGRPGSKILPRPAELESGGYSTLELPESPEPSAVSPKSERISPPAPEPKPSEAKAPDRHPGTETRRRQSVMPVIVQPMSEAEVDAAALAGATVPTFLAMKPAPPAAAPAPPPPPPPRVVPTATPISPPPTRTPPQTPVAAAPMVAALPADTTLPSPFLQATPVPPPSMAAPAAAEASKSDADRTFFITVLGRRIGPLTRQAARDLKSRELRGTLTFKDLDQFT